MNYSQTLEFLFSSMPTFQEKGVTAYKPGLERIAAFCRHLGNPQRNYFTIHVAGTNGKGSVSHIIAAVLQQAGYRTGLFTSPHLHDFRERIRVDGEMIPKQKVVNFVDKHREKMVDLELSFFEMTAAMAFDYFAQSDVEVAVIETGLGGRLDATNILLPIVSVVTNVGLEHTALLGDTLAKIAAEKAGIIKPGIPVVYDNNDRAAGAVIAAAADRLGSAAYGLTAEDSCWGVSFAAPYQAMNAALAVKVLEILEIEGVNAEVCRKALASVHWTGRMQQVAPNVWVDGAHNPGGIRAFIQAVKAQNGLAVQEKQSAQQPDQGEQNAADMHPQIQLLFAAVSDKDYHEMIRLLCTELSPERVTVVQLKSERGLQADALARQFEDAGCSHVTAFDSTKDALKHVLSEKKEGDHLYMVGSLYLIGEILEDLKLQLHRM